MDNTNNGGPKDIDEFVERFIKICEKGYIKTARSGPTGVGKTLENELGIKENSRQGPDFADYELKTHRISESNSMITLFTKKPEGKAANKILLEKFGYDNDGSRELHTTLKYGNEIAPKNGAHKMGLRFEEDRLYVTCDGLPMCDVYWELTSIEDSVKEKYIASKGVIAGALSRGSKENEEFLYKEAYEVSGINADKIIRLIKSGKIVVDIRLGTYGSGKPHDHGTGFRIAPRDTKYLFADIKDLIADYHKITVL